MAGSSTPFKVGDLLSLINDGDQITTATVTSIANRGGKTHVSLKDSEFHLERDVESTGDWTIMKHDDVIRICSAVVLP